MSSESPKRSWYTRHVPHAWLPVLLFVVVATALALTIPLVDPDEGRNAEVAKWPRAATW